MSFASSLLGGVGSLLGLGGSLLGGFAGQQNQTKNTTGTSTTANSNTSNSQSTPSYSPLQNDMQSSLATALGGLMQGGASPQIQGLQSQSASQINNEYNSMGQRMNQFLASRGFGQSGQVGQAALQGELGRQNALANNTATYGGMALNQLDTSLSDALNFAFKNPAIANASTSNGTSTNNFNQTQTAGSPGSGLMSGLAQWMGTNYGTNYPGGGNNSSGGSGISNSNGTYIGE